MTAKQTASVPMLRTFLNQMFESWDANGPVHPGVEVVDSLRAYLAEHTLPLGNAMSPDLNTMAEFSPSLYEAYADNLTEEQRRQVARATEQAVMSLTRFAVYMGYRTGTTHETAVKKSNSVLNTVRKALGYTYDLEPMRY